MSTLTFNYAAYLCGVLKPEEQQAFDAELKRYDSPTAMHAAAISRVFAAMAAATDDAPANEQANTLPREGAMEQLILNEFDEATQFAFSSELSSVLAFYSQDRRPCTKQMAAEETKRLEEVLQTILAASEATLPMLLAQLTPEVERIIDRLGPSADQAVHLAEEYAIALARVGRAEQALEFLTGISNRIARECGHFCLGLARVAGSRAWICAGEVENERALEAFAEAVDILLLVAGRADVSLHEMALCHARWAHAARRYSESEQLVKRLLRWLDSRAGEDSEARYFRVVARLQISALHCDRGQVDLATEEYASAISALGKDPSMPGLFALARTCHGEILEARGHWMDATEQYLEALKFHATNGSRSLEGMWNLFRLARTLNRTGRLREGNEALAMLKHRSKRVRRSVGRLYAMIEDECALNRLLAGQLPRAEAAARRAIAALNAERDVPPRHLAGLLVRLGHTLRLQNRFEEAREQFGYAAKALDAAPSADQSERLIIAIFVARCWSSEGRQVEADAVKADVTRLAQDVVRSPLIFAMLQGHPAEPELAGASGLFASQTRSWWGMPVSRGADPERSVPLAQPREAVRKTLVGQMNLPEEIGLQQGITIRQVEQTELMCLDAPVLVADLMLATFRRANAQRVTSV